LVLKTVGLVDFFRQALQPDPNIKLAFVFGSIARHEERGTSDVDLMVIGEIGMRQLSGLLSRVSGQIGREINPHIFRRNEFLKRKRSKDHFLMQVLESPKIFIIGNENEFAELA
jgi:predicted nucleotidyltransferase